MKKLLVWAVLFLMLIMPSKNLRALDVAQIGDTKYTTLEAAVSAANSGDTITILESSTASGLALEAGRILIIPSGKTITLTGKTVVKAGAIIENNGTIVVDDGLLDVSKLTYGATGLISSQSGTISVKDKGQVIMLDVWYTSANWYPGMPNQHILTNCEAGGSIVSGPNYYVFDGTTWKGSFQVETDNYTTFTEALSSIPSMGSTIKLLSDVMVPANSEIIGKKVDIDLNEHNLSSIKKVFFIKDSTVRIIGAGKVNNVINHDVVKSSTVDTSVIELRGSETETDTNYTNLYIGKDVTLEARVGVYIQHTNNKAWGVNLTIDGKINAVDDKQSGNVYGGVGIQTNGQIRNTENEPVIKLNKGSKITSTATGMYLAGYTDVTIEESEIDAVESGIAIKAGTLNLKNSKITVTGEDETPTEGFSNGVNASGAVIQIESNKSYVGDIKVNVDGGTYTSKNSVVFYEYLDFETPDTFVKEINVKSGNFNSAATKPNFLLSSELEIKNIVSVTGGVFTVNPNKYVLAGYKNVLVNKKYEVSKVAVGGGTRTLNGKVMNGANAIVQLKQGGIVVKTVKADPIGNYSFASLAPIQYNVYATNGFNSVLDYVDLTNKNKTLNLTLPLTGKTELIVEGKDTPNIVVLGLNEINDGDDNVELIVKIVESSSLNIEQEKIKELINNTKKTIQFLEINIKVNNSVISETNKVLEFVIPYDVFLENIELYRYHEDVAEKFERIDKDVTDKKDKQYYIDKDTNTIHVFASQFSTYAIVYGKNAKTNPKTGDAIIGFVILGVIGLVGSGFYLKKETIKV